jgi:hypothetical protein
MDELLANNELDRTSKEEAEFGAVLRNLPGEIGENHK